MNEAEQNAGVQSAVAIARIVKLSSCQSKVEKIRADLIYLQAGIVEEDQRTRCVARLVSNGQSALLTGVVALESTQRVLQLPAQIKDIRSRIFPIPSLTAVIHDSMYYYAGKNLKDKLDAIPMHQRLDALIQHMQPTDKDLDAAHTLAQAQQQEDPESYSLVEYKQAVVDRIVQSKQNDLEEMVGSTAMKILYNVIQADREHKARKVDQIILDSFNKAFLGHQSQLSLQIVADGAYVGSYAAAFFPGIGTTLAASLHAIALGTECIHWGHQYQSKPSTSVLIPTGDNMV